MRARRKYYVPDWDNPDAKAVCDRSGFIFRHGDLVKQMEWRGDSLEWTGLMVGPPFVNKPNEQLRNPILLPDPVPVELPRPYNSYNLVWSTTNIPWSSLPFPTWASWGGSQNGVLAAPVQDREQYLEEGVIPPQNYPGGGVSVSANELSQQQLFQELSHYNWSQP